MISKNIKTRIFTFGLVLMACIPTYFVSSFSHLANVFLLPGVLFGFAIAIPHLNRSLRDTIIIMTFPLVMSLLGLFNLGLGIVFEYLSSTYSGKLGVVVHGFVSSFVFLFIYDQYYSISNRKASYSIITSLGIMSALISDYLFLTLHTKELNIGKMVVIWQAIVGLGLIIFVRHEGIQSKESKVKNI